MLGLLGVLALVLGSKKKKSKYDVLLFVLVFAVASGMTLSACNSNPTPGNFNATGTATPVAGGIVATGTVDINGTTITGTAFFPSNTPYATITSTCTPTPTPLNIEWLSSSFKGDGGWLITHYTFALESDPEYANPPLSDRFPVPGLDPNKTYRRGFIWGPRGTWFQGTGKSESGEYITINYNETDIYNDNVVDYVFTYGKGGNPSSPPEAWKTAASRDPRLPDGTRFVVEAYPGKIFTKNDSGTELADSSQVDLFVGEITLAEADYLNEKFNYSRVGIVR